MCDSNQLKPGSSRTTNADKMAFSDKERIRMEEEGLCEEDFRKIPVDPGEEVECPDMLKSQGESCWDSKHLVKLEDLGNWTHDISPDENEENKKDNSTPIINETSSLNKKIKRPMKRKKKKQLEPPKAEKIVKSV